MRAEGYHQEWHFDAKHLPQNSPHKGNSQISRQAETAVNRKNSFQTTSPSHKKEASQLDVKQLVKEIHRIADLSKSNIPAPSHNSYSTIHAKAKQQSGQEGTSNIDQIIDEDHLELQGVINALSTPPDSHKRYRAKIEIDREHKSRQRRSRIHPSPQESSYSPNLVGNRSQKSHLTPRNDAKLVSSSLVMNPAHHICTETGASQVAQRIFSKLDSFLNRPPLQPKLDSAENSNLALKSTPISQSSSIIRYKENIHPPKPQQHARVERSTNSKVVSKSPMQENSSLLSLVDHSHGKLVVTDAKQNQVAAPPREFTKPAWVSFGSRSRSKISSSSADSKKSDGAAVELAFNETPIQGVGPNQNLLANGLNDSLQSQSRKSDYRLRYRPTKSPVGTNRGQVLEPSLSLAQKFRAEQTHNRSGVSGKLNSSVERRGLNLFGSGWENKTSQNLLTQKPDDTIADIPQKTGSSFRQSSFSILKLLTLNENSETKSGENQGLRPSRTVKSMPRKAVITGALRANQRPANAESNLSPLQYDSQNWIQKADEHHPAEQTVYLDLKTLQPEKGSARGDRGTKRGIPIKEQILTSSKTRKGGQDIVRQIEMEEETDQKPQFSPSSSARAQRVSKFEPNTEEPRRPIGIVSSHKTSGQVQTAATNKMTETGGIKAIVSMFSHGLNSTISNRKKRLNSTESIEPLNLQIMDSSGPEKLPSKTQLDKELHKTQDVLNTLKQIVGKFNGPKTLNIPGIELEKQVVCVSKELECYQRMKIAAMKIVTMIANRRIKERKKLALRKIWDRAIKTYDTNPQSYKS